MSKKGGYIGNLFGISFFGGTKSELLSLIEDHLISTKGIQIIFTPNPEQMVLSWKNSFFLEDLKNSSVNIPDGQGIVWALNKQLKVKSSTLKVMRIAGREVFHDLLVIAKEREGKVFLLGGKSGSAEMIAESYQSSVVSYQKDNNNHKLKTENRKLKTLNVEWDEGAKDIAHETDEEHDRVMKKIMTFKPDFLFVAYGAPWQERWVSANKDALEKAGVKLAMVVGGAFEYEAGKVPKVPSLVESLHLEWLWRLLHEPWRWQRQLKGLEFFWRVLFNI
jgi:N-acetylglucosaminyldiphosphoundecaprenol N-acetyl-beta-D-mannosaminyltransferase